MKNEDLAKALSATQAGTAGFGRREHGADKEGKYWVDLLAWSETSAKEAVNIDEILRKLPSVFRDISTLSELVVHQQEMILEQQQQIQMLAGAIDAVAVARIQTDVSSKLFDHIAEMATESHMYRYEGGKITLNVASSFASESSGSSKMSEASSNLLESQTKVGVELNTAVKLFPKLEVNSEIGIHIDRLNRKQNSFDLTQEYSSYSSKSVTMSGTAVYEHGKITCDPSLGIIKKLVDSDKKLDAELVAQIRHNPFAEIIFNSLGENS
jgi:hypothetical protein